MTLRYESSQATASGTYIGADNIPSGGQQSDHSFFISTLIPHIVDLAFAEYDNITVYEDDVYSQVCIISFFACSSIDNQWASGNN